MNQKPVVYLLCDSSNDLFKIGVTRKLTDKRLKLLQTGNGTELFIVHTYPCEYPFRLESMLHRKFQFKKSHGEWYRLEHADVVNFLQLCKEQDDIIHIMKDNEFFAKGLK